VITREELDAQVEAMQITMANVERDYVFGWLISGFYAESTMADRLTLKGGNALRKGYLPASRFSDDLDFSCAAALDGDGLLQTFNESCRYAGARSGVAFDLARNRIVAHHEVERGKSVYKLALYFQDFSGQARPVDIKVRVDVTEFDRLHLPVQTRNLIHQYSDVADCSVPIRLVALEEALADKLRCLLQRRYAYDLFDLVYGAFVSNDLAIDRGALMRTFLAKSIFRPNPQAAKRLLLTAPWDGLRAFWSKVVTPASSRFSFDDAVASLRVGLERTVRRPRRQPAHDWRVLSGANQVTDISRGCSAEANTHALSRRDSIHRALLLEVHEATRWRCP
jgi:predicted nucleotidyltransferase component of viral defense system